MARGRRNHEQARWSGERGGVLVAGLFITALMVGVLYMVVGAGTALQHGQMMQDAADSGAFMFAQLHAKAMNLITLMNLLKLSALACIVAPLCIIVGAEQTIAWINSNWVTQAMYGYWVPFLAALAMAATALATTVEARCAPILQVTHYGQKLMKRTLPVVAQIETAGELGDFYSPPINQMVSMPLTPLPVDFELKIKTCARAFPLAYTIIDTANNMMVPPGVPQVSSKTLAAAAYTGFCMSFVKSAAIPDLQAKPGEEPFQVRTFVMGDELSPLGERGVDVALWGSGGSTPAGALRDSLSRYAIAQAEYYYDGRVSRHFAMWRMKWRARLRRFNLGGASMWPIIH